MSLLEHQPFSAVGLTLRKRAMLQAAEGFAIGAGLVGAIIGVECMFRSYSVGSGADAIEGIDEYGHLLTYNNPIPAGLKWPQSLREINPPDGAESATADIQLGPSDVLFVPKTTIARLNQWVDQYLIKMIPVRPGIGLGGLF